MQGSGAVRGSPGELSRSVGAALRELGQGFLAHPDNRGLRAALEQQELSADAYLSQLLAVVYRWLWLLRAEERGLLHAAEADPSARARYAAEHGLSGLLRRSRERPGQDGSCQFWEQSKRLFRSFTCGEPQLGVPALGAFFAEAQCPALHAARLSDAALLGALFELGFRRTEAGPVELSFADLPPEELGRAYERALRLQPEIVQDAGAWRFGTGGENPGGTRRSTGSYYTPDALVQVVLDGALEPVIHDALQRYPSDPERALLGLRVVDPACGTGHFLLAAARRMARRLASRTAREEPTPRAYRRALSQVIQSCLYGVDLNPLAVELCRLNLWLEAEQPGMPLGELSTHIQLGNSLLGVLPAATPACSEPLSDWAQADAWCATRVAAEEPGAPRGIRRSAPPERIRELSRRYQFFHYALAFPEVFAQGGFDVVLGNPPWIAHAGRASQRLLPEIRRFFAETYEAFAGYPTTHGMFVSVAAQILREDGYLGLVVPSSVSELAGYGPARAAHDRLCDFPGELIDFGEGQFSGVTQPCMALVSRRCEGGRRGAAPGQPWPMQRSDLSAAAKALIDRLGRLAPLPSALFGERGVQSDKELAQHFCAAATPTGRFTAPVREGTDVREFELLPPRLHVDRAALGSRMRSAEEFAAVRAVVRQTARYPIAALSDGQAFRNSLLAVFDSPDWPAAALVALLNSALVRWLHYVRFRDARQPILPQLKIGHLRAIPSPPALARSGQERLLALGERLSTRGGGTQVLRAELDELVFGLYGLSPAEQQLVAAWHEEFRPRTNAWRGQPAAAPREG